MNIKKLTPIITITVVNEKSSVQIHCSYNGFGECGCDAVEVAKKMMIAHQLYDAVEMSDDLLCEALARLPQGSGLARSIQEQIERNSNLRLGKE